MSGSTEDLTSFEAVHYSRQVPRSSGSLTLLALVFDRIHFPGVYMPTVDIDEEATMREIERILSLGPLQIETGQMLSCMKFACHVKYVRDFCIFDGVRGHAGVLQDGAHELTLALEELIFGPPPKDFFPSPEMGFNKGVPALEGDPIEAQVNAPSWLSYPANALIVASKKGLPIVNDDPSLPIPGLPQVDPKANAKLLASMLTIESVKLALPRLRALTPKQLQEVRAELSQHVRPFRLAMLRLSKELNVAITSGMDLSQIQREAKFLAETSVYPELADLRKTIEDPGRPWHRRAVDLAMNIPELASAFATLPTHLAFSKVFASIAQALAGERDAQLEKQRKIERSGLAFLLKIEEQFQA
jgi:hypothetical protein